MINKLKQTIEAKYKYWIADFVSLFIFLVLASIVSTFLDSAYLGVVFFGSGLLHGKLSKPLEEKLVEKIK